MKRFIKKSATSLLALAMVLGSVNVTFANYNVNNSYIESGIESINFDYNTMSDSEKELFNKLVDKEVRNANIKARTTGDVFDEESFRSQLVSLFDGTLTEQERLYLSNSVVAAGINVAIGVVVGSGAGAVAAYVKSVGKDAAKKIFVKTITDRLIAWGAPAVAKTVGVLADFVLEVFDFGDKIAEYLDSTDKLPNNGRFDF